MINFKKFYKNGSFMVQNINIYGKWNNLMFKLHKKFHKKEKNDIKTTIKRKIS